MAGTRRRDLSAARRLTVKAAALGGALLLALTIVLVLLTVTAEGPAWLGRRRHGGVAVPALHAKVGLLAVLLPCLAYAAIGVASNLRRLWSIRVTPAVAGLAPGEPVRWRGRRGLRAIGADRWLVLAGGFMVLLVFGLLIANLWSGDGPLAGKLLFSFLLIFVFSGALFFAATIAPSLLAEGAHDVGGTLVVTDRRIAWLHPWRASIYRTIEAHAIVDVTLVEDDGRRGWVAVTVRKGDANVEAIDLTGLPDAAGATAAMRRLIPHPPAQEM